MEKNDLMFTILLHESPHHRKRSKSSTQSSINALIIQIKSLDVETKTGMEPTDKYYEPAVRFLYGPKNYHENQLHFSS